MHRESPASTERESVPFQIVQSALVALGWSLTVLPPTCAKIMASLLVWTWRVMVPVRRKVAEENIERALGHETSKRAQRAILNRMAHHLFLNLLEFLSIPHWTPRSLVGRFRWWGLENLDSALAREKGALVLSAHLGAFDLLACATAAKGYPVNIVSRTSRNTWIGHAWMSYRKNAGVRVLPERGALHQVLRALRRGEIVVLVIDQNMKHDRGVFVRYFGRPACTLDSLAILASRTGAPVVPVFTWRAADGRHEAVFLPHRALCRSTDLKADIVMNTQNFTSLVEAHVRAHPEQWLWLHRRWKTVPEPQAADQV